MADDIVTILRDWGTRDLKSRIVQTLLREAADEIERLRAIIDTMARTDRPVSLATAVVLAMKNEATDAE